LLPLEILDETMKLVTKFPYARDLFIVCVHNIINLYKIH